MAEFTLPKNSKIQKGKHFAAPAGAKSSKPRAAGLQRKAGAARSPWFAMSATCPGRRGGGITKSIPGTEQTP